MASKHRQARTPRHIPSDCHTRPELNPQIRQMIECIPQRRTHNNIDLTRFHMKYEVIRQFTFALYPRKGKPDIRQFIIAGFYYTGYGDEVVCYCCNLAKSGWTDNDTPTEIHFRMSPNCEFYSKNSDSEVNVPFFDLMGGERSFNLDRVHNIRMASKYRQARNPRHITSDCHSTPELNPQLQEIIECILQRRTHNNIELTPFQMKYEVIRQFTFALYPRKGKPDIRQFIIAGFYYTGYGDEVVCYCCNLAESGWADNDIPTKIHFGMSPNCDFYSRNSEVNVPFFDLMGEERSFDQEHTQMLQLPIQYTSENFQRIGNSSTQTPTVLAGSIHTTGDSPSTQKLNARFKVRENAFVRSQMVHRRCKSLLSLKGSRGERMATTQTQTKFSHHPDLKDTKQDRRLDFNAPTNRSTGKVKSHFCVMAADRETQSRDPGAEMCMYMCKICTDSTACVVLMPCAHLACCSPCSYYTDVCPECEQDIETKINVLNENSR